MKRLAVIDAPVFALKGGICAFVVNIKKTCAGSYAHLDQLHFSTVRSFIEAVVVAYEIHLYLPLYR